MKKLWSVTLSNMSGNLDYPSFAIDDTNIYVASATEIGAWGMLASILGKLDACLALKNGNKLWVTPVNIGDGYLIPGKRIDVEIRTH